MEHLRPRSRSRPHPPSRPARPPLGGVGLGPTDAGRGRGAGGSPLRDEALPVTIGVTPRTCSGTAARLPGAVESPRDRLGTSSTPSAACPQPASASALARGRGRQESAETDVDGRIRRLADTDPGTYRIAFYPASPFFRRVELEVDLGPGHHHVPLLVSSYACASYRGS
jgi:hypothetical protein